MTSGEGGVGRTCLRSGEVDPAGLASPCIEPTQAATVAPVASQSLPTVGVKDGVIAALIWAVVIVFLYHKIVTRGRKK